MTESASLRGPPAPLPPGRIALFLALWAAAALALLFAAREVLLPFVLALLVAYVLTPVVARLERARAPRWGAILGTYALTLGSIYGFGAAIAPRMGAEVAKLRGEIPARVEQFRRDWAPRLEEQLRRVSGPVGDEPDEWDQLSSAVRLVPGPNGSYDLYVGRGFEVKPSESGSFHIDQADAPRPGRGPSLLARTIAHAVEYGQKNTLELLRLGQVVVAAVSRAIFFFFLTLMLAAYMMLTRERIYAFFRSLCLPPARPSFDRLMTRVDRGLAGVVRGQLLICLVNGVLSALGFWLFGLKYWPILALLAALFSIIPIFGSILSSVPVVAIGLTQSLGTALAVLAWIVGVHQLEANFLNPKIIGDAAKIHPVLVVFSLVVGEHLF